uniref:Reverse transcriptase RNase H-like domain-containing protein n=1 Tax=Cannabis sativa TaxID=3483 RepID=A0A803Q832_CANSA
MRLAFMLFGCAFPYNICQGWHLKGLDSLSSASSFHKVLIGYMDILEKNEDALKSGMGVQQVVLSSTPPCPIALTPLAESEVELFVDVGVNNDKMLIKLRIIQDCHGDYSSTNCTPTKRNGQNSVEYLGHIISAQGVSADPAKIAAMAQWPVPKTLKELWAFLGLTGYFRKFELWHYCSTIDGPAIKRCFRMEQGSSTGLPTIERSHVLSTSFGLPDFSCHKPKQYMSEMAIMLAIHKWRPYLLERRFVVRTDQRSLNTDLGSKIRQQTPVHSDSTLAAISVPNVISIPELQARRNCITENQEQRRLAVPSNWTRQIDDFLPLTISARKRMPSSVKKVNPQQFGSDVVGGRAHARLRSAQRWAARSLVTLDHNSLKEWTNWIYVYRIAYWWFKY